MPKKKIEKNVLRHILISNEKTTISMTYKEFIDYVDFIKNSLNDNKCLAVFSDREVIFFFDKSPNVSFIVKSRKPLTIHNFKGLEIFQKGARHPLTYFTFIWEEIKLNWFPLLSILFLIGPFLIIQGDKDFVKELNSAIISATSILVGVFLVFITFFYLGKENELEYVSEGRFYTHFMNDKYIIFTCFLSILLSMGAIGLAYYSFDTSLPKFFIVDHIHKYYGIILKLPYQQVFAGFLTLISVMLFWISFRAMSGYYFTRIKNNIHITAVKQIHKKYFEDINDR
jgi:hypothetical protein